MLAPLVLSVAMLWPAELRLAGAPAGDASQGEALFEANCAMCHGNDATGMMGMHPALRGAVERLTVEGVEVTIRNGRDTRPPMPAFGDRLGDDDIAHLVAYLETLPPGPRNFGPEGTDGRMGEGGMGGMMDGGMNMSGGMWIGMALWGLLLVALIALAVAGTVRLIRGGGTRMSARERLDLRYAQGELDRDEYLQRRADMDRNQ